MRHELVSKKIKLNLVINRLLIGIIILGFSISTLFLVHSLRSNLDFLYLSQKKVSIGNAFDYALDNPYFKVYAQSIRMNMALEMSIKSGRKGNIQIYTRWAEQYLLHRPELNIYIGLAEAYQYLRMRKEFCNIGREGGRIYPHDPVLQEINKVCANR